MLEHRREGLCFNCDEPYVRGHQCQQLFYLEADDYLVNEVADNAGAEVAIEEDRLTPQSSLFTIAAIRTRNTMLLHVDVQGHRLLALLDTGSTHNFIHVGTMRRIGLVTADSANLRHGSQWGSPSLRGHGSQRPHMHQPGGFLHHLL